jgi:hypothetical protein
LVLTRRPSNFAHHKQFTGRLHGRDDKRAFVRGVLRCEWKRRGNLCTLTLNRRNQEWDRLIAPQKKVRNYLQLCYYQRRNTALCQKLLT